MNKRIAWIGLLIILFIGLAFFIFNASNVKEKSANDNVSLRLGWLHQAEFAGFYIADKKGFYKEERINITINPGGPDLFATKAVASGTDDFGVAAPSTLLLISRAAGIPIKAVAVIHQQDPFVMFSKKDSGIISPQDMVGKKVGVVPGSAGEIVQRTVWRKNGVDESKIEIYPAKFDMTPFLDGRVDVWEGYITNEPIILKNQGVFVNIIKPSDFGVSQYGDVIITTDKEIKEKPDLVRRFVRASLKGWEYALDYPDEAVDVILSYNSQLKREEQTEAMQTSIPLIKTSKTPLGLMDKNIWEGAQRMLLEQKLLSQPLNIDDVYTNEFVK